MRAFYEHPVERGKTKTQGLVAAMRKLLDAVFDAFKHDPTFDGSKAYALLNVPSPVAQEVAWVQINLSLYN